MTWDEEEFGPPGGKGPQRERRAERIHVRNGGMFTTRSTNGYGCLAVESNSFKPFDFSASKRRKRKQQQEELAGM